MATVERFSALYYRDFRLFIFGQLISLSGTWMQSVAQWWLVYDLTKSPFYLGLVGAAGSLPILLFALLGGIVADRFVKRNLLLTTAALSIVPAVFLGVLTDMNLVTVWHVALFATLLGTVNAFDIPARQAFFIEIVDREHLISAIALHSSTFHSARIIGPVIAGMTIAYMGLPACFYLNALSFLAIIIALSKIKARSEIQVKPEGFLRGFTEGVRFIKSEPEVLRIISLIAVLSLIGIPYITLLPVFAVDVLGVGAEGFGFLVGTTGAGSVSAALLIAFRGDVKGKKRFMFLSNLSFSIALFVFSLSKNFFLSLTSLLFVGWGLVSFLATSNSFIQLSVPDALRGRVMGVYALVFLGFAPMGNYIIGTLAEVVGTTKTVAISAVLYLIASVMFFSFRKQETIFKHSR